MSGFKIDVMEPSMYDVLGDEKIIELSTAFYNRLYTEDVENKDSEHYSYFGRFFENRDKGGPPLYSTTKGHPALRGRHRDFDINTQAANRWLFHMQNAINEVKLNEKEEIQQALMEFFEHVALFLRNRKD